jgi:zinc transport system permease protein
MITVLNVADFDMHGHLFGDVLAVKQAHVISIYGVLTLVVIAIVKFWQPLVLMTIHEDLAQAEGVNLNRLHILLLALVTMVVAVAMHIVGVLLITSMLIIPAATARQISHSPEGMAIAAIIVSVTSVLFGISLAEHFALPAGPAIVLANTVLFVLAIPIALARKH